MNIQTIEVLNHATSVVPEKIEDLSGFVITKINGCTVDNGNSIIQTENLRAIGSNVNDCDRELRIENKNNDDDDDDEEGERLFTGTFKSILMPNKPRKNQVS